MKRNLKIPKPIKQESLSFLTTLIATLIGVFMAIYLTDQGVRKKEKDDSTKLLNTINVITKQNIEHVNRMERFKSLVKDSTGKKSLEFNKSNPLPSTELLKSILSNDVVSKYLSEYSHSQAYSILLSADREINLNFSDAYKKRLSEFLYLISYELEYQKGIINSDLMLEKFKAKRDSIYNFTKMLDSANISKN